MIHRRNDPKLCVPCTRNYYEVIWGSFVSTVPGRCLFSGLFHLGILLDRDQVRRFAFGSTYGLDFPYFHRVYDFPLKFRSQTRILRWIYSAVKRSSPIEPWDSFQFTLHTFSTGMHSYASNGSFSIPVFFMESFFGFHSTPPPWYPESSHPPAAVVHTLTFFTHRGLGVCLFGLFFVHRYIKI